MRGGKVKDNIKDASVGLIRGAALIFISWLLLFVAVSVGNFPLERMPLAKHICEVKP